MLSHSESQPSKSKILIRLWCFCLLFLPLLVGLGFWQLERADENQEKLDLIELSKKKTPIAFDSNRPIQEYDGYQPVIVRGEYMEESLLLDNRTRDGKAGYELIQRFRSSEGTSLWVNRGWLKSPLYRDQQPSLDQVKGETSLIGEFYHSFAKGERVLEEGLIAIETFEKTAWPKRIQHVEALGHLNQEHSTFERVFRLTASQVPEGLQEQYPSKEEVYDIRWIDHIVRPEKNLGYAFQWFAMSVALVCLTLVASWKFTRTKESKDG